MYIKNAWYVIAWTNEVTREPLARTILEEEIVLYRTEDGTAVAMADRCAHRAYPLSKGRLSGDSITCGYHGFEFGPDGVCTKVPAQQSIPERALVRTYPVVEQFGWIWVWMGTPALAETVPVPQTPWMEDPEWAAVTHSKVFGCSADLIHDNLLDLTHESFLHADSIGDEAVYTNSITVEVEGRSVSVDRWMPDCFPSELFATASGLDRVDRWHTTEFIMPSIHIIHAGVVSPGGDREQGYLLEVCNAITPISADESYYFYGFCRNFRVDDQELTDLLTTSLDKVLIEDLDALELQHQRLATRPDDQPDVLIAQDAGVAKARRLMNKMLAAEQKERAATGRPARGRAS